MASSASHLEDEEDGIVRVPNGETLAHNLSSDAINSRTGGNVASSSGTNLRSSFIGMGFSSHLVDKAILNKGEDDADRLLEALLSYSAHEKINTASPDSFDSSSNDNKDINFARACGAVNHNEEALQMSKSASSNSLDSLFGDCRDSETVQATMDAHPKQEVDSLDDTVDNTRSSLLRMKFPEDEVEFAINKLDKNTSVDEVLDFILAARVAKDEDTALQKHLREDKREDINTETLFGTVDKTLHLLEMGFAEHDVSMAIETLGSEVPIAKLADWICGGREADSDARKAKGIASLYPSQVKMEDSSPDYTSQSSGGYQELSSGLIPKEEYDDEFGPFLKDFGVDDRKGKGPKQEYDDTFGTSSGPSRKRVKKGLLGSTSEPVCLPRRRPAQHYFNYPKIDPDSGRSMNKVVAEPPYFLYGNVASVSKDCWNKMSQFLYAIQPEFVNTQQFSALRRNEGYIHNLPIDGRHHMQPKSPMTIEEAFPQTKKWWPAWDTRKQLSSINSETAGITRMCDHVSKMLVESKGILNPQQQEMAFNYCQTLNLVWVGKDKLAPIPIEQLERILGYPMNHTKFPEISPAERLESLANGFQTDTLGYHISSLKSLFPGGVTLLSVYSGIGGAEIALHRLGVYLKGVVSVETSESKRKMVKRWWENSGQTGELVQLDEVEKLSGNRLDYLVKKFGGFDIIIGQNSCAHKPNKISKRGSSADAGAPGMDFPNFFEFVRVQQRVRSLMKISR